ncbi:MAG: hypothetical protein D6804_05570 [Aquificota bacterium]|nr:MAG: hypothetical protein D6804_05570 [Aquificota bacterium]
MSGSGCTTASGSISYGSSGFPTGSFVYVLGRLSSENYLVPVSMGIRVNNSTLGSYRVPGHLEYDETIGSFSVSYYGGSSAISNYYLAVYGSENCYSSCTCMYLPKSTSLSGSTTISLTATLQFSGSVRHALVIPSSLNPYVESGLEYTFSSRMECSTPSSSPSLKLFGPDIGANYYVEWKQVVGSVSTTYFTTLTSPSGTVSVSPPFTLSSLSVLRETTPADALRVSFSLSGAPSGTKCDFFISSGSYFAFIGGVPADIGYLRIPKLTASFFGSSGSIEMICKDGSGRGFSTSRTF